LELGTGEGGQLLNLAFDYPGADFVGFDLSSLQIDRARWCAERLGLRNVQFHQGDIGALPEDLGTFDYVICHGVHSWVPEPVRLAAMEAIRRHLGPHGVAMVSYNTRPGWDVITHLRDAALEVASQVTDLSERIAATREVFQTMLHEVDRGNPYSRLVEQALTVALGAKDSYLAHEHLSVVNDPSFLHEVVTQAADHGLRYLDDLASPATPPIVTPDASPPRCLADVWPQHLFDLVNGVRFRAGVLCHGAVPVSERTDPTTLRGLHMTAPLRSVEPDTPSNPDTASHAVSRFVSQNGRRLQTTSPTMVRVLRTLVEHYPSSVPVDDLLASSRDADALLQRLDGLGTSGLAWFTTEPIVHATAMSTRPVVPAVTRLALEIGEPAANRQYELVPLNPFARFIAIRLDGSRSTADLVDASMAALDCGELVVADPDDRHPTRAEMAAFVSDVLQALLVDGLIQG
jgi:SAM-dependent methyltransferase/methyltransferase-like protein